MKELYELDLHHCDNIKGKNSCSDSEFQRSGVEYFHITSWQQHHLSEDILQADRRQRREFPDSCPGVHLVLNQQNSAIHVQGGSSLTSFTDIAVVSLIRFLGHSKSRQDDKEWLSWEPKKTTCLQALACDPSPWVLWRIATTLRATLWTWGQLNYGGRLMKKDHFNVSLTKNINGPVVSLRIFLHS